MSQEERAKQNNKTFEQIIARQQKEEQIEVLDYFFNVLETYLEDATQELEDVKSDLKKCSRTNVVIVDDIQDDINYTLAILKNVALKLEKLKDFIDYEFADGKISSK